MQELQQPPEYAAVCHILAAPVLRRRTAPYVLEEDFDWEGLLREADELHPGDRSALPLPRLGSAVAVAVSWDESAEDIAA